VRPTVVAVGSVVAVVVTLVVGAQLWERPRHRRVRKQVLLLNVATTATVVIGVLTLYAVLFLLALAGALLVVAPLFAEGLGHPAHLSDHLELAWLTCSLATVGGALGAGLESDDRSGRPPTPTGRSSRRPDPGPLRPDRLHPHCSVPDDRGVSIAVRFRAALDDVREPDLADPELLPSRLARACARDAGRGRRGAEREH
jgi:hypothetical protein